MDDLQRARGEGILAIIRRLVDDSDELIARVESMRRIVRDGGVTDEAEEIAIVAQRIVTSYANRAALVGGATSIVAAFPGLGTLLALGGGLVADVSLTLKYEIEMALCLAHLYGHDIRTPEGRELAYLLATVGTYETKTGESASDDVDLRDGAALGRRMPPQAGKLMLNVLSRLALRRTWKGLLRALPVVGVLFGASANKLLTTSVGHLCADVLAARRLPAPDDDAPGAVVDALLEGE